MRSSLYSLCLGLFYTANRVNGQIADAMVESMTYADGEGGFSFVDLKDGGLAEIISTYQFEVIISGLGFGEGPKWIQDCDYVNNGYILVGDQYSNCLWKYWQESEGANYTLECVREMEDGDMPNAVGWNLNYPDEIYVANQGSNTVVRLDISSEGWPELNRWNESSDGTKIWNVNDVILDSQGNAYFTTYPFNVDPDSIESDVVSGAWTIPRDTMEVELIEEMNYGTNGIAMTLDETLLIFANTMDYPAGEFDGGADGQVNYTNLYWRGYNNQGSISTSNSFSTDDAFDYLRMEEIMDYFDDKSVADGSAFDFDDNYWQSVIFGDTAEGHILITNAETYAADEDAVIGIVNFTGSGYGPTNVAKGMDGYMYITLTQWNGDCGAGEPGWGCGGILGRIPLASYLTNENDASSDYVLDCSTAGDDDDDDDDDDANNDDDTGDDTGDDDDNADDDDAGDDDDDDDSAAPWNTITTFGIIVSLIVCSLFF